jgi:hypothetical protein
MQRVPHPIRLPRKFGRSGPALSRPVRKGGWQTVNFKFNLERYKSGAFQPCKERKDGAPLNRGDAYENEARGTLQRWTDGLSG